MWFIRRTTGGRLVQQQPAGPVHPVGVHRHDAHGDQIASGKSFLDIRSFYKHDPDRPKVLACLNGGAAQSFTCHRFWAQTGVAMAMADYGLTIEGA